MRALISVSDKSGIVGFARELSGLGVEIISTGGTAKVLSENGIDVIGISDITGFPECLGGRVKTLHPAVHGGILARRDDPAHMEQIEELGIETIDIVAINLYPFRETVSRPDVTLAEAIENIDIGGPTMLRSAAKNHRDVTVICDPSDYDAVTEELKEKNKVEYDTKYRLALKVFEHTAAYDSLISEYLRGEIGAELPDNPTFVFEKIQDLRYGENPHQKAVYYREMFPAAGSIVNAEQLHGKELSYNNINDTDGAVATLREFTDPTVVAVKHANPCGVGTGKDIFEAYEKAYKADPVSIFGGIIAANREIDKKTAEKINEIFIEIVIAPGFAEEAIDILSTKKNIRLLEHPDIMQKYAGKDSKKIVGGILVQDIDAQLFLREDVKTVTKKQPTEEEMEELLFAMKVAKHIKSNGIVIAKSGQTTGIGPGQVNRIWAVENAIRQSTEETKGSVLASDAFFPFEDCVEAAGRAGITAIIQPGGSMNDEASIKKADELGIAMVFTGMRHFKH